MENKLYKNIATSLLHNTPALIGRFGTVELECVLYSEAFPGKPLHPSMLEMIESNAGVFPTSEESINIWLAATRKSVESADILAVGWYSQMTKSEIISQQERKLLIKWGWYSAEKAVALRDLEPYYSQDMRWTSLLEGLDVCVVGSFAESAKLQVAKGEDRIWPGAGGSLWAAKVRWHWVQTGYAPVLAQGRANWEESPESWEEAVDWVVSEVMKTNARVVLIGCGGLGMIIGSRLKAAGKICVVMGGAIQVLFGIKGGRWANQDISKFWNDEWTWPSADETPRGALTVEKGCYWNSTND